MFIYVVTLGLASNVFCYKKVDLLFQRVAINISQFSEHVT